MKNEEINNFPPIARRYLEYLSSIKNKSELTVLEYASDLRIYFRFLMIKYNIVEKNAEFDSVDISLIPEDLILNARLDDAYAYLTYCRNVRGVDSTARARKAVSLKRFYRYLEANGIIEKNVMVFVESPKVKKSLPKYLSLKQSNDLLRAVDGKNAQRDYCILTLFLNCGLRLSELVNINISDIRDDATLIVTGKGNKERVIYLNNSCLLAIKSYMAVRPKDNVIDRDALFLSNRRTRISREMVQKTVEKTLKNAGLDNKGFSTHKLRHTAATLMYQYGGVDPIQLKEILGHENLSTTEIYTHTNNEQLRKAVDSNPLNNSDAEKSAEKKDE